VSQNASAVTQLLPVPGDATTMAMPTPRRSRGVRAPQISSSTSWNTAQRRHCRVMGNGRRRPSRSAGTEATTTRASPRPPPTNLDPRTHQSPAGAPLHAVERVRLAALTHVTHEVPGKSTSPGCRTVRAHVRCDPCSRPPVRGDRGAVQPGGHRPKATAWRQILHARDTSAPPAGGCGRRGEDDDPVGRPDRDRQRPGRDLCSRGSPVRSPTVLRVWRGGRESCTRCGRGLVIDSEFSVTVAA